MKKQQLKATGLKVEQKIDKCAEQLRDAGKTSKNFLPKIQRMGHHARFHAQKKNPEIFDFESYKLNPWEEDQIVVNKYKDFMNQPIHKLEKMQKKYAKKK